MTTLTKTPHEAEFGHPAFATVDIKRITANAIWYAFLAVGSYAVALALVALAYLLGGHMYSEAFYANSAYIYDGQHPWYWSAVFLGALWTWVSAWVVAGVVAAVTWAYHYPEGH